MHATTRRLGLGSLLTVTGAVLVVASLPMTWYHAHRATHTALTGWGVFTNLRIWLVAAAVLALASALLPQGRSALASRAVLGLLAGLPVLRRIVDPPDGAVQLDNRIGVYVALCGALAIVAGGLLDAGRRVATHYGWDVPGAGSRAALPAPSPAPDASAAQPLVEAQVVEER